MNHCTFGFIGTGNMGGALAAAAAKTLPGEEIILANRTPEKARKLAERLGCLSGDNKAAAAARYVFLGVKPQMLGEMLPEILPVLAGRDDRFVLVSMLAGLSAADIQSACGAPYPVIRIMPNIPASVGEGMTLLCASPEVTEEEIAFFCEKMAASGRIDRIGENLIDAASAVAGCGPAFAALFIEALADGGVKCGLPRAKAQQYAAQMLLGTAAQLLRTGEHPGVFKDSVCSPGGSTIAGVYALERGGFRGDVIDAVEQSYLRTKALKNG